MSTRPHRPTGEPADPVLSAFVVTSEITVPPGGEQDLESAFAHRLGEVDAWPGFLDLQVWRDAAADGVYTMVSWWTDEPAFTAYMRSVAHRRSHARIPGGPTRPRAAGVRRFSVVAR